MKVYKYSVHQITPRGKHINVFEKVVQSEMSYIELSDYLADKYTGFTVNVEEVKELETIGSTNKRTYMSYEKMYKHCMKLSFNLDYSKDEEFIKLIELNRELIEFKQKFTSRVYNEVKEDLKYKGIREKAITVELLSGRDKVTLSGEVMLKDLKLVQE
jgi:hypothetical protein